ncbi:MAG TPA: GNAT family N-acetyltransferase [Candidatus Saccharimonadales bacterium]|nr:GNAT family N-acetyltransferase [Candidatus Saccharimonadales bacterium]
MTPVVRALDAEAYRAAIPELAALIVDAVAGGAGVNFLDGVTVSQAAGWWEERIGQVEAGVITPFVALDGERIVGSVLLIRSRNPNSPHRAEIGKVIVSRSARRQGLGAALMAAAEARAVTDGRWLLILDTVTDSAADAFYRALDWQVVGVVPNHALLPDGTPSATTFFYKDLR